jgi:hypothetical protein
VPNFSFTPIRDDTVYAIYAIDAPLPVTVTWPSCRQTLAFVEYPYPPHHALEFFSSVECTEAGLVHELESLEHGKRIVHQGLKVPAPGVLDAFCARLVKDGRAHLIAGRHCDIPWASHIETRLAGTSPGLELDAFWL